MYKIHLIFSAYALIGSHVVNSESVSLVYTYPTTEAPLDLLSSIKENIVIEHYVLTIQIFIFICSIITLYYLIKQKARRTANIVFHLTNGHECFDLVVFEFRTCILEFDITFPSMPVTFDVYGTLKPEIGLHWKDFKVTNKATSQELHIKNKFKISPTEAYVIQNIIKSAYSSHLFLDDRGVQFYINAATHEDRQQMASLYPRLAY